MAILCEKCGKRMVTAKILELHMIKSHGGVSKEEVTTIKPEEVKTAPVKEEAKPIMSEVVILPGFVTIESQDGRELEVSIGKEQWKGKVISVPKEMQVADKDGNVTTVNMVDEVVRLLKSGGYYISING